MVNVTSCRRSGLKPCGAPNHPSKRRCQRGGRILGGGQTLEGVSTVEVVESVLVAFRLLESKGFLLGVRQKESGKK